MYIGVIGVSRWAPMLPPSCIQSTGYIGVSANATTHHLLGTSTVSTQCQPVSTSIKLPVVSTCNKLVTLQSDKSHLFKWLVKKNGYLVVSGSDLGFELLKSSLRQNSSCTCVWTSFYLPCINSQAVISTISWNQWKSSLSCLWTGQDSAHHSQGVTVFLQLANQLNWDCTAREGHKWKNCCFSFKFLLQGSLESRWLCSDCDFWPNLTNQSLFYYTTRCM